MTKFLFTLFFISTISTVQAQTAPAVQWQNAIGGKNMGFVHYMTPTKDSGYIAVGYADSVRGKNIPNYHGVIDVWVAKLDSRCNIIWQKCYGGSDEESVNAIHSTPDGGYVVAGYTRSIDGDVKGLHQKGLGRDFDGWVIKLDSIWNLQWQKCLGGSNEERLYEVLQINGATI